MEIDASFRNLASDVRDFMQRTSKQEINAQTLVLPDEESDFNALALRVFAFQFKHNAPYRALCQKRGLTPSEVSQWPAIPAVPTVAFKTADWSSIAPAERLRVFYSSGTTGQSASQHYHHADSLKLYESSILPWFAQHVLPGAAMPLRFIALTPSTALAPHSSLVFMLEAIIQRFGGEGGAFFGGLESPAAWTVDAEKVVENMRAASCADQPLVLLGTAFNFVHLLDYLSREKLVLKLPAGSRVMETGGYKGRSQALPKAQLHTMISHRLSVPENHIVSEYGMCELSSQAYDLQIPSSLMLPESPMTPKTRIFHFPPWARAQILSPETGQTVPSGATGLLCICDLANLWSVMAIQTEDLGTRRDDGFDLLGRSERSEPRGCSLMSGGFNPAASGDVASPGDRLAFER